MQTHESKSIIRCKCFPSLPGWNRYPTITGRGPLGRFPPFPPCYGCINGNETTEWKVNPMILHLWAWIVRLWVALSQWKILLTPTYYISTCEEFYKESCIWSSFNVKIHSLKVIIDLLKVSELRVQFGLSKLLTITGTIYIIIISAIL